MDICGIIPAWDEHFAISFLSKDGTSVAAHVVSMGPGQILLSDNTEN